MEEEVSMFWGRRGRVQVGPRKIGKIALWVWVVAAVAVAATLLVGCGGTAQAPAAVCATWQAPDGTWMEEDNEEVDSDPCDRQPDAKKSTLKPVPPTPKKTSSTSGGVGGVKKKF